MPIKEIASQNSFCRVIFSPRNSAANPTSMNGCTLYTAVPMAIEAREYEANNSTQLPTIATPLSTASKNVVRVRMPGRRKPNSRADQQQGAGAEHAAPEHHVEHRLPGDQHEPADRPGYQHGGGHFK